MKRRSLLLAAGALPVAGLRAEHGWEAYDLARPLYLEGEVAVILWSDPHPHLELLHRQDARLPHDLLLRRIPRQRDPIDLVAVLARAVVPPAANDRRWRVDLPTLARLSKWGLPRPKIKQVIGVIGYPGPPVTGTSTLRAEVLFIGDRAYPLRSDPA